MLLVQAHGYGYPTAPGSELLPDSGTGVWQELWESANCNNPFLLHVAVQSGLQIDVEVKDASQDALHIIYYII